jgi:hypothetical protein
LGSTPEKATSAALTPATGRMGSSSTEKIQASFQCDNRDMAAIPVAVPVPGITGKDPPSGQAGMEWKPRPAGEAGRGIP